MASESDKGGALITRLTASKVPLEQVQRAPPPGPGQLQPAGHRAREIGGGGPNPKRQVPAAQGGGVSGHRPLAVQPVGGPTLATIRG